jgi:cysteine sulfinate desulfinase/cysteine desulfurase-like protein
MLGEIVTNKSATIYVKSKKVVTGEISVTEPHLVSPSRGSPASADFSPLYETRTEKQYGYVLPDEQKAVLETVKRLCEKHGFELKIIDVTRENLVRRALQEEIRRVKSFPTLMTDSGRRIEGNISEEQIELFLLRNSIY